MRLNAQELPSLEDRFLSDFSLQALLYLLIAASGMASLAYEILWVRQASLGFGSSALALSTVLAVFFLGLGLGNLGFGRLAPTLKQPLLWCAGLESLLALNGLLSPILFAWAEQGFGALYQHLSPDALQINFIRMAWVTLILLPPTVLMGGTLPLFCRQLIRQDHLIATPLSRIYAANTMGAAVGCFLTGFYGLPQLGLKQSTYSVAMINVLLGVGFLMLNIKVNTPFRENKPIFSKGQASLMPKSSLFLPGLLFFMVGVAALANELIWARFLSQFIRNSVYTYTLALGVVLVGAAIGSLWQGSRFDNDNEKVRVGVYFAVLQASSALLVQGLTHLPAAWWQSMQAIGVWVLVLLMLPVAILSGICFPLLNRMVSSASQTAPRSIGAMTSINITGCIVGSLLTGFWLLPQFGLDASIRLITAWSLLAALLSLAAIWHEKPRPFKTARGVALLGALWLVWIVFPPVVMPRDYLEKKDVLLDYREGYNANLAVVMRDDAKTLLIDHLWQGVAQKNYQVMVAHVPMLHYPDAKQVLVVGLGAGTTAARFLYYDIRQLDIVDIEPKLFAFTREHFPSAWMDDTRVRLLPGDGRNFVKHGAQSYDLISVEIGQLDRPGVGVFYTQEFYREARARLNENGMISQFVPLRFLRPADLASILKTFLSVFPQARIWYNTDELLLLGFKDRVHAVSEQNFAYYAARPHIHSDLNLFYWGGARYPLLDFPVFLAGFLASGDQLQQWALWETGEVYNDDKLQLSYRLSDYRRKDQRALALVPRLQNGLTPIEQALDAKGTDSRTLDIAHYVRKYNVADIAASDILGLLTPEEKQQSPALALDQAKQALQWNPLNVYAQAQRQSALFNLKQNQR